VLVFNRDGKLLKSWGGPADPGFLTTKCVAPTCQWPTNEHGIYVDHMDDVYIAGNGGASHQVLKFTNDGNFVYQIGVAGAFTGGRGIDTNGSPNGTPLLGQPADMEVDPATNELYIADGYQNKRVLVVDAHTGLYKRHWGAYGRRGHETAPRRLSAPAARRVQLLMLTAPRSMTMMRSTMRSECCRSDSDRITDIPSRLRL
jgi:hypothetical protein